MRLVLTMLPVLVFPLHAQDGWKIVSIADTFQREGCPRR